ncbi:hypothetical protein OS493_012469 [Desmophyllum pertusum]|uniref:Uncharacterized protein n=1 Tax=Desmophyllum pertusum TaxID=174260 RepID=A0A9W9ZRG4_9CNID|nr:hypothetical protein OS493_012469 [Desmophyllum pertusum]
MKLSIPLNFLNKLFVSDFKLYDKYNRYCVKKWDLRVGDIISGPDKGQFTDRFRRPKYCHHTNYCRVKAELSDNEVILEKLKDWISGNAVKVSTEIQSFIGVLLRQYLREVDTGELCQPRIVYPAVGNVNPSSVPVMLPVLLWDPLIQFPDIFNGFLCPYCALDCKVGIVRTTTIWNDGTSKKRNPRKIFDINHPVLLVARSYRCGV